MNLENFVSKYNGQRIDFDEKYAYQCVDLIKLYISEFLGKNYGAIGHAKDYFRTLPVRDFEKIKFTGDLSIFKKGDIIVWDKSKGNGYGHIGIVYKVGKNFLEILEQNGELGKSQGINGDEIRIKKFTNFSGIVGACRFKNLQISEKKEISEFEKLLEEAKNLGIWNGKDPEKLTPRKEAVIMAYSSHINLKKDFENLKKDFEILKKDLEKFKK